MPSPSVGKRAPAFSAAATGDQKIASKDLRGKKVVLYFYPKDNTPGCTTETQDFGKAYKKFEKLNTLILGVSRDSLKSHEKFKAKLDLPFELLSDEDETVCNKYDVIKLKKLYGKEYMGIERSTFLIDEEGKLRAEWRKVKVKGHVDDVLAAVKALDSE